FITLGPERIFRFFRQGHQIDALHVAINVGELFVTERRFEIARRAQKQIFAVIAENWFARAIPIVRDRGLLFARERIKINARKSILLWPSPRDPLTVRRPVENFDLTVFVLIDLS